MHEVRTIAIDVLRRLSVCHAASCFSTVQIRLNGSRSCLGWTVGNLGNTVLDGNPDIPTNLMRPLPNYSEHLLWIPAQKQRACCYGTVRWWIETPLDRTLSLDNELGAQEFLWSKGHCYSVEGPYHSIMVPLQLDQNRKLRNAYDTREILKVSIKYNEAASVHTR